MSKRLRVGVFMVLAAMVAIAGVRQASASTITLNHTWTGTETSGPDRLFRDGIPSVAGTQKPFPGTLPNDPTYFYYIEEVNVLPGSVVSVVTLDSSLYSFFSLYDTSLNPGNLATNYLGDAGSSGPGVTFSITAPASGDVLLVASSVFQRDAIGQLAHAEMTFTPVPEPSTLALLGIGLGTIGLAAWRRRH